MTEQETIKVLTVIVMAYPSSAKFNDETTPKGMAAVWKDIFKDDNAQLVEMAVKKHISVNSYPPSIAEIRKQMLDIARPDIIPPDIAWTMVSDVLNTESEYEHFDLHSPKWWQELLKLSAGINCISFIAEVQGEIKTVWTEWHLWTYTSRYTSESEKRLCYPKIYGMYAKRSGKKSAAIL